MGRRESAPDKRSRLVEAASRLVYERGFNRTTLADIASAADVPLGNVYYYFKTKEALGEALVEQRSAEAQALRLEWARHPEPKKRLVAFLEGTLERRRELARRGCPIGTLCAELRKEGGPVAKQAAELFADALQWLEQQFRALGSGSESRELAAHVLSVVQGATVLAHAFGKPSYVQREVRRLQEWIGAL